MIEVLRWMVTVVLFAALALLVVKWIGYEIQWREERRRRRPW